MTPPQVRPIRYCYRYAGEPPAPTGLTASSKAGEITLSWTAPTAYVDMPAIIKYQYRYTSVEVADGAPDWAEDNEDPHDTFRTGLIQAQEAHWTQSSPCALEPMACSCWPARPTTSRCGL